MVDERLDGLEAEYQQAFEFERAQRQKETSPADEHDPEAALQPYLQWVIDLCSGTKLKFQSLPGVGDLIDGLPAEMEQPRHVQQLL